MKKTLLSALLSLLCVLFLITACDSPAGVIPKETTTAETPAGSDISPDETTAENEIPPSETTDADSSTIITTTEPYETVDPDLLYEIRSGSFADEAWLKRTLPNIMDISVEYRISEKEFEPFFYKSSDDYKTLSEWIELLGKPHGFTNRSGNLDFVWITQEGTFIPGAIDFMTTSVPEGITLEERLLHFSKIYIYLPRPAPESRDPSVTTAKPETTREKAPETTAEPYVETTTLAP